MSNNNFLDDLLIRLADVYGSSKAKNDCVLIQFTGPQADSERTAVTHLQAEGSIEGPITDVAASVNFTDRGYAKYEARINALRKLRR